MKRVILAGGGTAGHVNPLIASGHCLRAQGVEVKVLGTRTGLETTLVPNAGFELLFTEQVALPRRISKEFFSFPWRLKRAVAGVRDLLHEFKPQVVVGFGGYVSAPAYWAAKQAKIPFVLHEQNMLPGVANQVGARYAAGVGLTFPHTPLQAKKGATAVVGMPLRASIELLAKARIENIDCEVKTQALKELGLSSQMPTLLVTGGSLGAQSINAAISEAMESILSAGVQVLHLSGRGKDEAIRAALSKIPERLQEQYVVLPYLEQMELAYSVADLVVCRSGAGTVAELGALGIPAILVPYPVGNGEQAKNGQVLVQAQAALMVKDADFTADYVKNTVLPLVINSNKLASMGQAGRTVMPAGGAERFIAFVRECLEVKA